MRDEERLRKKDAGRERSEKKESKTGAGDESFVRAREVE